MGIFIPCCGSSASSEGDTARDSGGVVDDNSLITEGVEGNIGVEGVVVEADTAEDAGKGANDANGELRQKVIAEYEEYKAKSFANVPDISAGELLVREEDGGDSGDTNFLLLDCRSEPERAVSVIPGAISKGDFEADPQKFAGRTVIVYCTIGYRSGLYTRDLIARGIHAVNLRGGVLAWAIAGQPFVNLQTGEETRRVHVYGKQWDLLPANYEAVY